MRKKPIITAVLASVMVMCFAQKPHKIMFYNMENFFDTIDDPETNDEEVPSPTVRSGGIRPSTTRNPATWSACCSTSPPSTATIRR